MTESINPPCVVCGFDGYFLTNERGTKCPDCGHIAARAD